MITCIPQTSQVSLFINNSQSHKFASKGFTSSTTFDPPLSLSRLQIKKTSSTCIFLICSQSRDGRCFLKRFILVLRVSSLLNVDSAVCPLLSKRSWHWPDLITIATHDKHTRTNTAPVLSLMSRQSSIRADSLTEVQYDFRPLSP